MKAKKKCKKLKVVSKSKGVELKTKIDKTSKVKFGEDEILRELLVSTLDVLKPCISETNMYPMLQCFYFDSNKISASNAVQGISVEFKHGLSACCVDGDLFHKLIASYKTEKVKLVQAKGAVLINSGRSNVKLNFDEVKEFGFEPERKIKNLPTIKIEDKFITGMEKCLPLVPNESVNESYLGVCVDFSKKGSFMYATNGIMVGKYVLDTESFKQDIKVLLPKLFCGQLVSLFKEFKEGDLYVGESFAQVSFNKGKVILYTAIADVEFTDFEKMYKMYFTPGVKFAAKPDELGDALTRNLLMLKNDIGNELSISIEKKNMFFSVEGVGGKMEDSFGLSSSIGDVQYKVDCVYFEKIVPLIKELALVKRDAIGDACVLLGRDENYSVMLNGLG